MDVRIIKKCFLTWRKLHDKGVEEMKWLLHVIILYWERKSKTFNGYLSHSKQGITCFCALLSDLSPYQNFVSTFFPPNNREGKQAQITCSSSCIF